MAENTPTVSSLVKTQFSAHAQQRREKLQEAKTFVATLKEHSAEGQKPSADEVMEGRKRIKSVQDEIELTGFWGAIAAGANEKLSDEAVSRKLETLGKNLEMTRLTTERASRVLEQLAKK